MPRPKLNLTEEERQERLKEQRRKNSLAYYHRHNPPKPIMLGNVEQMTEYIEKRKNYFKQYSFDLIPFIPVFQSLKALLFPFDFEYCVRFISY